MTPLDTLADIVGPKNLLRDPADIAHLRPTYFATVSADMNKAWAQKVPGK